MIDRRGFLESVAVFAIAPALPLAPAAMVPMPLVRPQPGPYCDVDLPPYFELIPGDEPLPPHYVSVMTKEDEGWVLTIVERDPSGRVVNFPMACRNRA